MPYGTPETGASATYAAFFADTGNKVQMDITVRPGEGSGTESERDGIFQQILDLLDGASFLVGPLGDGAHKDQHTNTSVTPTP